jgi:hypothetical protein
MTGNVSVDGSFVALLKTLRSRLEHNPQAGMGRLDLALPDGSEAKTLDEVAAVMNMDREVVALAVLQADGVSTELWNEAKDVHGMSGNLVVPRGIGTVMQRAQMVQRGRRYYSEDERERRRRRRRRQREKAMRAPDTSEYNDSVCVMLAVDGVEPWPGGLKKEDLHVTLAWYDKADDYDMPQVEMWERLKKIADKYEVFPVRLNGITRFAADEGSKLGDPIVVNADAKEIESLRNDVIKECGPHKSDHGYSPHMTLAFIDVDDPMPVQRYEVKGATITGIILSYGKFQETIPFRKAAK